MDEFYVVAARGEACRRRWRRGGWMETEPLILNEGRDEREHVVVVQNLHKLRRRREVVG